MMEFKDWLSFFVGGIIASAGILPLLNKLGVGPKWFTLEFLPVAILTYIVAIAGLYLLINSFIEITNSNGIGWISLLIAFIVIAIGIIPVLHQFGILNFTIPFLEGTIGRTIHNVIFIIEGFFLMIACFAMEM